MFGILARSLNIATGAERSWSAPDHWTDNDRRTRAQKERDAADQRRWMRGTGVL